MNNNIEASSASLMHDEHKKVVHSTWKEERNGEFPQVLEYRSHWQQLGYEVRVTPNQDIRRDVERLVAMTNLTDGGKTNRLLETFDHLPTTNLQFDFWRYAILYLEGGTYADVDVDPRSRINDWQQYATTTQSVVVFEESPTWMGDSQWMKMLRPFVCNYPDLPAYGSCVVVAPSTPNHSFFLDLLLAVNLEEWMDTPEPQRTLMMVGPGHLTRFVKARLDVDVTDVVVVSQLEAKEAYQHDGFGTWKSSSTILFEKLGSKACLYSIFLVMGLLLVLFRMRRGRGDRGSKRRCKACHGLCKCT